MEVGKVVEVENEYGGVLVRHVKVWANLRQGRRGFREVW